MRGRPTRSGISARRVGQSMAQAQPSMKAIAMRCQRASRPVANSNATVANMPNVSVCAATMRGRRPIRSASRRQNHRQAEREWSGRSRPSRHMPAESGQLQHQPAQHDHLHVIGQPPDRAGSQEKAIVGIRPGLRERRMPVGTAIVTLVKISPHLARAAPYSVCDSQMGFLYSLGCGGTTKSMAAVEPDQREILLQSSILRAKRSIWRGVARLSCPTLKDQ